MLPEADCAAAHQALRRLTPAAEGLLEEAGLATGDYILAHQIPKLAQGILRLMPGGLAAPLFTKPIARHSWTFAGTGVFRVDSSRPLVVSVARNPLVAGWNTATPQCIWHVGVFRRLYGRLVWPGGGCARWRVARAAIRRVGSRFLPGSPHTHPLSTEGEGRCCAWRRGPMCQRRACVNVILARLGCVRFN
jgi:bacteriochlorophyll 4-vinyl reductase